jgi:hypothetical protein
MYGKSPSSSNHVHDAVSEFVISYGEKSNRVLMDQYGFVLHGNQFDRLEDLMPQLVLPGNLGRLRKKRVVQSQMEVERKVISNTGGMAAYCYGLDGEADDLLLDGTGGEDLVWQMLKSNVTIKRLHAATAGIIRTASVR